MKTKKRKKLDLRVVKILGIMLVVSLVNVTAVLFVLYFDEASEEVFENISFMSSMISPTLYIYEEPDEDDMVDLLEYYNAQATPGENVDKWLETGRDNVYEEAVNRLLSQSMKKLYFWDEVFVIKFDKDEEGNLINDAIVVLDLYSTGEVRYDLGQHLGEYAYFETIKRVYETNKTQDITDGEREKNGFDAISFAPIDYQDGTISAFAGLRVRGSTISLAVLQSNGIIAVVSAINIIMLGIAITAFIRLKIVKPIKILSTHMRDFVSDEGSLRYEPVTEIHTNDEIEQIADDFNELAQRTIKFTKDLEQKTTEEERLRVDLDVASQIRNVISSEPTYPPFPERTDFDICARLSYTMYNRCSFCNYFFTDPDHLFIIAGEPLGNSFASMIFSVLAVSYIKSFAKLGFEPYKIALETNNELCSIEKTDPGLTVGIIIIEVELKTGIMKYINAGMPPMLIKKPGENYVLDKPDKPFSLGQMRGVTFEQNTLRLYQGSTVLLTSSGVTDMCDPQGTKYGFERLTDVMNRISGSVSGLDKTVSQLEKDINDFRKDSPVSQDTMILVFRYFG